MIPAFNCEDSIYRTLLSVAGQSYSNWRIVLIDDMSTDNTREAVETAANSLGISDKTIVISRSEKYGEVRNTLDIVRNYAEPNDIIVRLDAGDYLVDLDAFAIINVAYQQTGCEVLWTAHRWGLTDKNISGPLIANTSVYDQPWVSSHLKTFRARNLEPINLENFKDENGDWIMIACDQAIFLPMMEHIRINNSNPMALFFLPRIMYHYSIDLSDPNLFNQPRSFRQKASAEFIRERGYIQ